MSGEKRSFSETSCSKIVWKVGPYVDGELDLEECEEVEAHLDHCEECAGMASEFRGMDRQAAQDRAPPVSAEEWSSLWERIEAHSRALLEKKTAIHRLAVKRSFPRWALMAASAAALIFLSVVIFRGLTPPSSPPDESFAEVHVYGPNPVIGDENDTTTLKYTDF